MEQLNGIDVFIIAVLLLSAILSFSRGFICEMLGIGAWFVAGIAGFYGMPYLEPHILKYVSKPILANIGSFIFIALSTLIILTLIFSRITGKIRKSALNRLDHFLGFIFGLVRGVVILVLIYFLVMTLAPKSLQKFQKISKTFPYLERVTDNVKQHLPESLFDNPTKKEAEKPDNIDELIEKLNKTSVPNKQKTVIEKPADPEQKSLFEKLNSPVVKPTTNQQEPVGYDKDERDELDKLFLESLDDIDSAV